jgi:hypothetical protein
VPETPEIDKNLKTNNNLIGLTDAGKIEKETPYL